MSGTNRYEWGLTRLLVSPRLRFIRHLLLIAALGVISFNQTFHLLGSIEGITGTIVYTTGSITLLFYLSLVYFNIYVLVPGFLLKRRYTLYAVYLGTSILLFLLLQLVKEYSVCTLWRLPALRNSYVNIVTVLDIVSNFFLNLICAAGLSFTVLMKHWLSGAEKVNLLEKQQIEQEVENLKEQVNPDLLFKILNRTAALSRFEPEKATEMLYKLSGLLRYQLYDCARGTVLLTTVFRFLENYLSLEQLYSANFSYRFETPGNATGIFIEPLLFLPFVEDAANRCNRQEGAATAEFVFTTTENRIQFRCRTTGAPAARKKSFRRIIQRLEILYPEQFCLQLSGNEQQRECLVELEIQIRHA
ncbi:MAG: histidine kinase [Tannerellaceae bacterium]|nr:histidine kinase [Tannerellaceae bacterium]